MIKLSDINFKKHIRRFIYGLGYTSFVIIPFAVIAILHKLIGPGAAVLFICLSLGLAVIYFAGMIATLDIEINEEYEKKN